MSESETTVGSIKLYCLLTISKRHGNTNTEDIKKTQEHRGGHEEEPHALCSGETQLATETHHTDQPWRRALYSMRIKKCADKSL